MSADVLRHFWPFHHPATTEALAAPRGWIRALGEGIYWSGVGHGFTAACILAAILTLLWFLFSSRSSMSPGGRASVIIGLIGIVLWWGGRVNDVPPPADVARAPSPERSRVSPRRPRLRADLLVGKITFDGPVAPDGKTTVAVDLPEGLRLHNTGGNDLAPGPDGRPTNPKREPGKGSGLCVFTALAHAARLQNERPLFDFQDKMTHEPGGGYPDKVDAMLKKYAPGVQYLQYEGNDPSILVAALKSGRMPGVTYDGRDDHYQGRRISHMVNLACYDEDSDQAAIIDNNFPTTHAWMSCRDFLDRWRGNQRNAWAVILLAPKPPSPPRN